MSESNQRLLILFSRQQCSLCDQAEQLVREVLSAAEMVGWQLHKADIDTRSEWLSRYATSIPVLRREDTGAELYWPFPPSRVRQLLEAR